MRLMKIKSLLVTIIVIFISYCQLHAQNELSPEKEKIKEVSFVFSNLQSFGFAYKMGHSKLVWRTINLSYSGSDLSSLRESNFSGEEEPSIRESDIKNHILVVKSGLEGRAAILRDLEFRYGFDLSFEYRKRSSKTFDIQTEYKTDISSTGFAPGVNFVLGFNYVIKDKLVIGAEVNPRFQYVIAEEVERYESKGEERVFKTDYSIFDASIDQSSVQLSIGYRF